MKSAKYWIEKLELIPHPEGGYFKEAFRSEEGISKTALPERYTPEGITTLRSIFC
jgi:predicted cupin superfamily sugar epimerase